MNIREKVYSYPTKHKEGFVQSEVEALLKEYPDIDMEKFNSALRGNTCMVKDNEIVNYHCDIEKALLCGIEKRNLCSYEWD
jgi:hypothetical protein